MRWVCLMVLSVVLSSAAAAVLAADADPSGAGLSRSRATAVAARAAQPRRAGRKRSSKRTRCVAASRGRRHAKRHRKAHRRCVVKRSKRRATKPGAGGGSSPAPVSPGPGAPAGGAGTPTSGAPASPVSPSEAAGPFRFFSATSFWNESVPADAPLDPSSTAIVGAFENEIAKAEKAKKGLPSINTTAWSVPIYTVPAGQPTVRVTHAGTSSATALQSAWDAVPLPAGAQPAAGTDKHLVVWQPSSGRLWEFWHLEDVGASWRASWGGAMRNASSDSGAYGPGAWPGAASNWGASASSLSIAGGLITLEDLEKGEINHALAVAIPNPRAGVYASPAQRTDGGSTEPLSLPEGAHLRLEPGLDLASLHLPRLTLMMAEAAQRYGIFIRDTASNVAFYAQDPIPTGANPYAGAQGYFEGESPAQLLASFPWSHLQLLKMQLHSTS